MSGEPGSKKVIVTGGAGFIGSHTVVELAEAAALFRGTQGRIKHAEGFAPLRLFINVAPED